MNEVILDKIAAYLRMELNSNEMAEFENQIKNEAELEKAIEVERSLMNGIKASGRNRLQSEMDNWHKEISGSKKELGISPSNKEEDNIVPINRNKNRTILFTIAAVLTLFAIGPFIYNQLFSTVENTPIANEEKSDRNPNLLSNKKIKEKPLEPSLQYLIPVANSSKQIKIKVYPKEKKAGEANLLPLIYYRFDGNQLELYGDYEKNELSISESGSKFHLKIKEKRYLLELTSGKEALKRLK